ncbi:hypothetical protein [Bradyrhizobium sp. RDM4]|uniref:hypothetical protein n=1 Tax=Bradyrhizobium sp. RDM4 TaxID=3378765 RepID=UPI0038FC0E93
MEERLFQEVSITPPGSHQENAGIEAISLNRQTFSDPTLGEILRGIVKKFEIIVARFEGEVTPNGRMQEQRRLDNVGRISA